MEGEFENNNLNEEEMKKLIADLPNIIRDLEKENESNLGIKNFTELEHSS